MSKAESIVSETYRSSQSALQKSYQVALDEIQKAPGGSKAVSPESLIFPTLRSVSKNTLADHREIYVESDRESNGWTIEVMDTPFCKEIKMFRRLKNGWQFQYYSVSSGACEHSSITCASGEIDKCTETEQGITRSIINNHGPFSTEVVHRLNYSTLEANGLPVETVDLFIGTRVEPDLSFGNLKSPTARNRPLIPNLIKHDPGVAHYSWNVVKTREGGRLPLYNEFGLKETTKINPGRQPWKIYSGPNNTYNEGRIPVITIETGTFDLARVYLPSESFLHLKELDSKILLAHLTEALNQWQLDLNSPVFALTLAEVALNMPLFLVILRDSTYGLPGRLKAIPGSKRGEIKLILCPQYPGIEFSFRESYLVINGRYQFIDAGLVLRPEDIKGLELAPSF